MLRNAIPHAALLTAAMLLAPPAPAQDAPPASPFTQLSFAEARGAAEERQRLLLVDVTSTTCEPCLGMARDVWPDPRVTAWIDEHALAVRVVAEVETGLAYELGFRGTPTIALYVGDVLLDRRTRELDAASLVEWFDDVAAGRAAISGDARRVAQAFALLRSDNVLARFDAAQELTVTGHHALALQHLLGLWEDTRDDPEFLGIHCGLPLIPWVKQLMAADDDAYAACMGLYAEARAAVTRTDEPDLLSWMEYVSWCGALGRDDEPLARLDALRQPDGTIAVPWWLAEPALGLLADAGRWADAGRVAGLPHVAREKVRAARRDIIGPTTLDAEDQRTWVRTQERGLRNDLARIATALRAADDGPAARDVEALLLQQLDDGDSRLTLVRTSADVVPPFPEQAAWLREALELGADARVVQALRTRLGNAVREQQVTDRRDTSTER